MEPPDAARIRRARPDELDVLYQLHVEAFGPRIAFSRDVLRHLLRNARGTSLVAEVDGEPVGLAIAVERGSDIARLWTVHVAPRLRGRGLAGRLLDELEDVLRARRVRRVELQVWRGNEAAIRLYRSRGYEVTGLNTEAFETEQPPGAHEMGKDLS